MNRSFVRGLWGIPNRTDKFYARRDKVARDIQFARLNPFEQPTMNYVFGSDNYKFLVDLGFTCKLVDEKPIVWDLTIEAFRHKIEVLKCGMEDFDEIVFLDWDCFPFRELPSDFWERFKKDGKQPFQAALRVYKRRRLAWRKVNKTTVPFGPFVYVGNKEVPKQIISSWEEIGRPWSEERAFARYTDTVMGEWKGYEEYWKLFEPEYYVDNVHSPEMMKKKYLCFAHANKRHMRHLLSGVQNAKDIEAKKAYVKSAFASKCNV